jgi:sarcosine oxidase subunit alpha
MLHLYLMAGGQQTWSPEVGAFIATTSEKGTVKLIGAANARFTARDALKDGATLEDNNFSFGDVTGNNGPIGQGLPIAPILQTDKQRAFVDFQHDVTVADIELAAREGFRSIEHTKRYTTS